MHYRVVNHIYNLRTEKDITQETLADAVGVTRQTIITIEKGNYTPSVFLALKIAKFFRRPADYIFTLPK